MRNASGASVYRIKQEDHVLFMSLFTFDAAKRKAIIKRLALEGSRISSGVQVRMEVVDLSKNRAFRIFEVTDPKAILEYNLSWNGMAVVETVPVMETEDVLEVLDRINGKEERFEVLSHSLDLASMM